MIAKGLKSLGNFRVVRERTAKTAAPAAKSAAPCRKLMKWDAQADISAPSAKKFDTIKDGEQIVDYSNVVIEGYLSTFKNTTESDRDGDYVDKGAFTETIKKFLTNPVLLVNHRNQVEDLAGSFESIKEDNAGLRFKARLSNSPSEKMKHIRALVAEGHLKTVSMGGLFHYKEDGRGIFKVDLWEGSLTPIPANPDAVFSVREPTESEMKMVKLEVSSELQNQAE